MVSVVHYARATAEGGERHEKVQLSPGAQWGGSRGCRRRHVLRSMSVAAAAASDASVHRSSRCGSSAGASGRCHRPRRFSAAARDGRGPVEAMVGPAFRWPFTQDLHLRLIAAASPRLLSPSRFQRARNIRFSFWYRFILVISRKIDSPISRRSGFEIWRMRQCLIICINKYINKNMYTGNFLNKLRKIYNI